jgi:hypothetical protein
VRMDEATGEALLERVRGDFYVPFDDARAAIRSHSSFNLIDNDSALKVDVFVAGDGVLDRMQIDRRVKVDLPDTPGGMWVTSVEDQVLRKLDWFRQSGGSSDRQWRDVLGILRLHLASADLGYLRTTAALVDLTDELERALALAAPREES